MKILKSIVTSLSILLIVASGGILLLSHWSAFGWKALSVPTGSMRPAMPPGSLALMHRVPDASLKVGDVITYDNPLNPKTTISHRIIKKYQVDGKVPAFITKGDANPSPDVPVVEGLVQGQVVWHIRGIGELLMWSKTWLGIAVLIYLPALLVIVEEIMRMNDYYKQWQPYRLLGYGGYHLLKEEAKRWTPKLTAGLATFAAVMFVAGAFGPQVAALLSSNTVALAPNTLKIAANTSGGGGTGTCSGNNNNNINVNNTTTQTAKSGNANSSNNTTGGSATSGSASNNNNTSVTITVTNC